MSQNCTTVRSYYMEGDKMERRKIYAYKLLSEYDVFHLSKEFYKYVYRYPELEETQDWREIKAQAEDYIVREHIRNNKISQFESDDYREFLRFYTSLENRFYDEERELIFTELEKEHFISLIKKLNKQ